MAIISVPALAQNTLYDDNRLSSIYIEIPPDSLQVIYDSVLSDHYYMARFVFDDGSDKDTLENIGFRLRGNTSRYSQKKSFKISFNEYAPGREYQGVKKLNLNGEHNDPAMIREKLYYEMWKKTGMPERRTSFVRLYINHAYYGLYTNLEEMDKNWLSRVFEKNGGNLFKCVYPADLVYLGEDPQVYKDLENSTVTGGRVYELETNKSGDDYTRLALLISVLHQQPDDQFVKDISRILDTDMFLKALAMDVATGNWDDYSYNRNNFYLYDDPVDSLFRFITYDPDNTYGVDWFGIDWGTRNCLNWVNGGIQLPLAKKLLSVPAFFGRYKLFLDTMARKIINPDTAYPRIDAMKALIQQAVEEDIYRTLDYGYTVDDFNDSFIEGIDSHTPYGLKPFLGKRMSSILEQINPGGLQDSDIFSAGLKVYPDPASDHITLYPVDPSLKHIVIRIMDQTGILRKEIKWMNQGSGRVILPVTDLQAGIYIVQIESTRKNFQAKFIKY